MRVELHPCYLLHQRSYRETSSILDVFSKDHGRVSILAKGVKSKSKNNVQGLLQPCQKLMLSWAGKGELPTLNKVELSSAAKTLSNKTLMLIFYINELVIKLLHQNEPHLELFDVYERTLNDLDSENEEQIILRRFEKYLLNTIGYGLVLDYDTIHEKPIEKDTEYYYSLETGPTINAPEFGEYVRLKGETLIALDQELFETKKSLNEAKLLTRYVLKTILGNKPLQSRELYQSYLKT